MEVTHLTPISGAVECTWCGVGLTMEVGVYQNLIHVGSNLF